MENNICWSRKVISSAISRALSVEMFSCEGTSGGFISSRRFSLLWLASSFFRSRRSCVAALCSAGSRLEVQTMSSRKRVVRYLSLEPSKSWRCSCYCPGGPPLTQRAHLAVFSDPVSQHREHSHCGGRVSQRDFTSSWVTQRLGLRLSVPGVVRPSRGRSKGMGGAAGARPEGEQMEELRVSFTLILTLTQSQSQGYLELGDW